MVFWCRVQGLVLRIFGFDEARGLGWGCWGAGFQVIRVHSGLALTVAMILDTGRTQFKLQCAS